MKKNKMDEIDIFSRIKDLPNVQFVGFEPVKDLNSELTGNSELTLEEIALIYVHNGEIVTRENCMEKARVYGHDGGAKLYQHFTFYSKRINRRSKPKEETQNTFKNKIERFEKVIPYITDENGIEQIMEDIRVLKNLYAADYE